MRVRTGRLGIYLSSNGLRPDRRIGPPGASRYRPPRRGHRIPRDEREIDGRRPPREEDLGGGKLGTLSFFFFFLFLFFLCFGRQRRRIGLSAGLPPRRIRAGRKGRVFVRSP